jgi:hypothetical protein
MQGKTVYIKPKVVRPFPGPGASGSYMHQAALFSHVHVSMFASACSASPGSCPLRICSLPFYCTIELAKLPFHFQKTLS